MRASGYVGDIEWNYVFGEGTRSMQVLSLAGLLIATEGQVFPRVNSTLFPFPLGGLKFLEHEPDNSGIFLFSTNDLNLDILNGPTGIGAPSKPDGSPLLYGDHMLWATYETEEATRGPQPSYPIEDLQIGVTVFLFADDALSNAVFIRYDILYVSTEAISPFLIGFGSDIDINRFGNSLGPECSSLDQVSNQSGYDMERHASYVYLSRFPGEDNLPDTCFGAVVGMAILDMTTPSGLGQNMHAHSPWIQNEPTTEYLDSRSFQTENGIYLSLRGMLPTGNPFHDPTTGDPSRYAFTGDPINRTGWLSDRHDVGSVLSLEAISLAPGETRSMTVAFMFANGSSLADGIAGFRAQFDRVQAMRNEWDY